MIQLLGIIVFALLLYLGQKYVYAKIWQRDLKVSLSFREVFCYHLVCGVNFLMYAVLGNDLAGF